MIYSRKTLDNLKKIIPITEVAEHLGFKLIKTGSVIQSQCIHEGDNTPSLTFFPETNSFYCYGCRNGGDVITFIAWVLDISFPEAIQKLAEISDIKLDPEPSNQLISEQVNRSRTYWRELNKSPPALEYLKGREIISDDINKWRLGMTPKDHVYPGRIVFTILDESSQTVGFAYRALDGSKPKYINSPDSPIFKKSHILYGFNYAKRMVKECDYIVLVEGYTDVIQLQKYNIPTVGLMGTALSKEQIEKIKKCTNNIILFFDGDEPGQKSAKAHAKTLKEHRFNVKSVLTDKDPDEIAIIHKDGIANFIEENAISIPGYEINLLLADGARKIDDIIISSLRKIIPLLVDIPDSIELEYYIEKVSVALGIKKPDLYRMIAEGGYYGSVN